jgi:uncharacterized protein YndB with AHSA1/START domain/GAF domain-containing protein
MPDAIPVPGAALDEQARLAALHACAILDTLPEAAFEDLVELAQRVCGTPAAAISFIDSDRQWLKAARGIEQGVAREHAFCNHTIQGAGTLVVADATADPRFADNPYVAGYPGVRFYAGAPLVTSEGARVGAICVLDRQPRALDNGQLVMLEMLARQVSTQLELRRQKATLQEALAERDALEARRVLSERLREAVTAAEGARVAEASALAALAEPFGATAAAAWRVAREGAPLELVAHAGEGAARGAFFEACGSTPFAIDVGLPGRVWRTRVPQWLESFTHEPALPRLSAARAAGLVAAVAVPLFDGGVCAGVIELFFAADHPRDEAVVARLVDAASELGALLRARFGEVLPRTGAPEGEPAFDPELDVRLELDLTCSVRHLWRGYTEPALLEQWFCPRPWRVASCAIEQRVGGRFRTVMRGPEGEEHAGDGCFLELVRERRVVWTNALVGGFRPAPSASGGVGFGFTARVSFEPRAAGSRVVAVVSHATRADRDRHAEMGFEAGWTAAFRQLEALEA